MVSRETNITLDIDSMVSRETIIDVNTLSMVSRETVSITNSLSPDFVAGVVSTCGTFFHIQTARIDQFGFQIKLPATNRELLELIRQALGLRSPVRIFQTNETKYALLITRSKKELKAKVVPYLEDRMSGQKLLQFLKWKNMLN